MHIVGVLLAGDDRSRWCRSKRVRNSRGRKDDKLQVIAADRMMIGCSEMSSKVIGIVGGVLVGPT